MWYKDSHTCVFNQSVHDLATPLSIDLFCCSRCTQSHASSRLGPDWCVHGGLITSVCEAFRFRVSGMVMITRVWEWNCSHVNVHGKGTKTQPGYWDLKRTQISLSTTSHRNQRPPFSISLSLLRVHVVTWEQGLAGEFVALRLEISWQRGQGVGLAGPHQFTGIYFALSMHS